MRIQDSKDFAIQQLMQSAFTLICLGTVSDADHIKEVGEKFLVDNDHDECVNLAVTKCLNVVADAIYGEEKDRMDRIESRRLVRESKCLKSAATSE